MKKLLSIILALAMITALIPATFAEGETTEGVTIEYSFEFGSGKKTSDITYANTKGAVMFEADSAGKGLSFTDTYTRLNTRNNSYVAFKIRVPASGTYRVSLNLASPHASSSEGSAIVDVYIVPTSIDLNNSALSSERVVLSQVGATAETAYSNTTGVDLDAGEYYLVFKRNGTRGSGENIHFTWLKDFTLDGGDGRALIYADMSISDEDAVLDAGIDETATVSFSNVYMSDGVAATEEEISQIEIISTNEAAATVSGNTITAEAVGTTTIQAKVRDYILAEKEITVTNSKLSGVKVEYSFLQIGSDTNAKTALSYENTQGRFAFEDMNSGKTTGVTQGLYRFDIRNGNYVAFRLRVPKTGTYNITFYPSCESKPNTIIADMYVLPGNTANIESALTEEACLIKDISAVALTESYSAEKELTAGEWLFVFKRTGSNETTLTTHDFKPKAITLNGGDGSALIWSNMTLADNTLIVGEKTTLTSNPYMSTGVAATEEEADVITYESTNNSVATVASGTVTAIGEGTAKIQAKSGDFVLGEVDVTVTRPKAPTVSFYAESTDNTNTPITITATDSDGNPVSAATATTLNRGAEVTVKAPDYDGYLFVGWFRGSKENGRFVWADNEYSFAAMTHTMLTAVYEEAPEKAYYNFNGEFLGTSEPSINPTMLGYKFDGWNETVYNNLTRFVANYLKNRDTTYTVTLPSGVSVEKDEDDYYYDTKVTLTSESAVTWLRDGKPVEYGTTYTFYIWDDVKITTAPAADTAPKVILDSSKFGAYMIEYDAGDKTIIEKGIIFGTDADITIDSCDAKLNSQRNEAHGQFTASSDYTNARGYIIYEDNGEYKVIYAD